MKSTPSGRNSEMRYRRLFESARDGVLIVDPETRKIIDANPYMSELLGYSRETLLGKELFEIGPAQDAAASRAAFQELQAQGFIRYENLPLQTRTGQPREVEIISNIYQEGKREVIQCNVRDIAARKRAEHELAEARDEAVAALKAKDDFIAALSHELRTPLNPVLLLASAALADPTMPAKARKIFAEIVKNVKLEARLIDDLLDLTRITHGKMKLDRELVDVHLALRDALATVQPELEAKRFVVRLNFLATRSVVKGDSTRLRQIFWNVLRNAEKFTPAGGSITVSTALQANGMLGIKITDTGIGMGASEIRRIFTSFAQGDHAGPGGSHRFGGLGLGLSISRMLANLHGGTIRAESRGPNQGSTFLIELPLWAGSVPANPPRFDHALAQFETVPAAGSSPGRILLVEDHESTRQALTQLLRRRRYEVVAAGSLAEARTAAKAATFDVLISDIGLPDGDGYELMADLRDHFALPGIAMTGYGEEKNIQRSREAGFAAHLTKPVSIGTLESALASVAALRRK